MQNGKSEQKKICRNQSEEKHSESEFYYQDDTISEDVVSTHENQGSKNQTLQNSQEEILSVVYETQVIGSKEF